MTSPQTRDRRTGYACTECGFAAPKWVGRCPHCQAWGSVAAAAPAGRRLHPVAPAPVAVPARRIAEVDATVARARSTGVGELDRALGGGVVPGSVVLLAGEPGVGKSTLLLTAASACAGRVLYVTGEESAAQVKLRAERVGAVSTELYLAAESDLATVLGHVAAVEPALLVVDSVQTLSDAAVDGSAGGVTQVRHVAATLTRAAKERGMATILVGHVTKDGAVAGPRVLEHMVDVVLTVEGDRHTGLRLVRAVKNRFGPADEVGCFQLVDGGVLELPDPSGLFLSRRGEAVSGTCVTVAVEGRRPFVAEVQALVASTAGVPRRASSGLDGARLAMMLAVLARRGGIGLASHDVYAATVGGMRVTEPAADLAVALAVAGAATDAALPAGLLAVGEVGLAGDVRPVPAVARRCADAARLGFTTALVPPGSDAADTPLTVVEVADLRAALTWLGRDAR